MPRTKVIIAGPKSSGKTCLALILTKKPFPDTYVPIVFQPQVFDVTDGAEQHEIVLEVMDETDLNSAIGHQEVNVIMLCIGVNDPQGVTRMELWVHKLKTLFTNSRLILVGTKCDLGRAPNSSALARAYDRTMADSQRTSAYVECSARTQYGISDLVKAVLEPAVTNVTPTFASKVMDLCLIQ